MANRYNSQPKRGGKGVLRNPADAEKPAQLDKYNTKGGGNKGVAPQRMNKRGNARPGRRGTFADGTTYNSKSQGSNKFQTADVEFLRGQGRTDQEIVDMMNTMDPRNVGSNAQYELGLGKRSGDYESLADFNPAEFGNARVNTGDVKAALEGGEFTARELNKHIKSKGYGVGRSAQKLLNSRIEPLKNEVAKAQGKDGATAPGPSEATAVPGEKFTNLSTTTTTQIGLAGDGTLGDDNVGPKQEIEQTLNDQDTINSDKQNIGGNLTSDISGINYGSNLVNSDLSVNINSGAQQGMNAANSRSSAGGSAGQSTGSMGFNDLGLDNLASATATNALLNNQLQRSRADMTGMGRGAAASAAAENITGSKDRVATLDYYTQMNPYYNQAKSDEYTKLAFGDVYNNNFANRLGGGLEFARPESPVNPEMDYDLDDTLDKIKKTGG